MVFWLIIKIIAIQIIVAGIIIFILRKILNRQLIDLAINKLEILKVETIGEDLKEVVVVVCGGLSQATQERIAYIVSKKLNRKINVVTAQDKKIKGGIIIKLKNGNIDYSLISRLKESGMLR